MLAIGLLLALAESWLEVRHRVALVITAGLSYLGFVILLTLQALRAQPIVHPDAMSLLLFGGLALATTATGAGILAHGRGRRRITA